MRKRLQHSVRGWVTLLIVREESSGKMKIDSDERKVVIYEE